MNSTAGAESSWNLLDVLDALVLRDGAASGLRGEVCVGLRRGEEFTWWSATFTPVFGTRFSNVRSNSAHATLFIDAEDAAELLDSGMVRQPKLLSIDGDRELLDDFVTRYTSRTDALGIRLPGGKR